MRLKENSSGQRSENKHGARRRKDANSETFLGLVAEI